MPEGKSAGALRTIGEVSAELGVPQHVLRYWETRFPQLKPLTRAGNRRYYRPEDVALLRRIQRALTHDGYTVKGAQKLLGEGGASSVAAPAPQAPPPPAAAPAAVAPIAPLLAIRDALREALRGEA